MRIFSCASRWPRLSKRNISPRCPWMIPRSMEISVMARVRSGGLQAFHVLHSFCLRCELRGQPVSEKYCPSQHYSTRNVTQTRFESRPKNCFLRVISRGGIYSSPCFHHTGSIKHTCKERREPIRTWCGNFLDSHVLLKATSTKIRMCNTDYPFCTVCNQKISKVLKPHGKPGISRAYARHASVFERTSYQPKFLWGECYRVAPDSFISFSHNSLGPNTTW